MPTIITKDSLDKRIIALERKNCFLPPRITSVQATAIVSPTEGSIIYVTDTNITFTVKGWYGYNGAAWEKLNN